MPAHPHKLRNMLAPVFCTSREEQENFSRFYDQWLSFHPDIFTQAVKAQEVKPTEPSPERRLERSIPASRFKWWILPLAVATFTALFVLVALVRFVPPPVNLSGVVNNQSQNPIGGASVQLIERENKIILTEVFTDENGQFTANYNSAASPNLLLRVHKPGYAYKEMAMADFQGSVILMPSKTAPDPPAIRKSSWFLRMIDFYQNNKLWIASGLAGIILLCVALVWLRRFSQSRELKKWRARNKPQLSSLTVKGAEEELARILALRRTAQEMRQYRLYNAQDLDVKKTIETTIREGLFTPAYSSRRSLTEYLVLINRSSLKDQNAQLVNELAERLIQNDVFIERYFFQEDARICRRADAKAPYQRLTDLAAQYPDHYLIIFSDGTSLFDPLTGQPQPWLERFSSWPTRVLMTSDFQPDDYNERMLSELGFRVLPANKAGLAALSKTDHSNSLRMWNDGGRINPLPSILQERPGRWLESYPPNIKIINELCDELQSFLSSDGYFWLTACAVYPMLCWDITLYLGFNLVSLDNIQEKFSTLLRLPWFREGTMPDWLRERLIAELSPEKEQVIRAALEDLLLSALLNPEGFVLPLVHKKKVVEIGLLKKAWSRLSKRVRELKNRRFILGIIKSEPDNSQLQDYVLLSFLSGRKPNRLALAFPNELRALFSPQKESNTGEAVSLGANIKSYARFNPFTYGNFIKVILVMRRGLMSVYDLIDPRFSKQPSYDPVDLDLRLSETRDVSLTPGALYQMPSPPAHFVGRDYELKELKSKLNHGWITISGMRGMGGVGKTALALKFAEQVAPHYPDAQLFLDLKGTSREPVLPSEAMAYVIRTFNPTAKLPNSEDELKAMYLATLEGKRALLLLANARSARQVRLLIPPPSCMLLVTTRNHSSAAGMFQMQLDTMSDKDARELLLAIAPHIEEYADEIGRYWQGLPMALRLASGAVNHLSPKEYLRRITWNIKKKRLELIEEAISINYGLLAPEMQDQLQGLTVFADSFDLAAAATILGLETNEAQDMLNRFVALSLVEEDYKNRRYRLHDLIRTFTAAQISRSSIDAAFERHAMYYLNILKQAEKLYLSGGEAIAQGLALLDLNSTNIQAGRAWAEKNMNRYKSAAVLYEGYAVAGLHILRSRQPEDELTKADFIVAPANVPARTLSLRKLILLIVGSVIGSGIFLSPSFMLGQIENSPGVMLLAWVCGGVLTLFGALTYGELSAMKPQSGGPYVYIRDCFGELPAFLFGWTICFAISGGYVAILAGVFSNQLGNIIPLTPVMVKSVSVGMIIVIATVNIYGTRLSANLLSLTTIIMLGALLVISAVLLWFGHGFSEQGMTFLPAHFNTTLLSGFGTVMISILWSYEGWQCSTFSAGEVVDPQRNFPRALVIGILILIGVYILASLAYIAALGPSGAAVTSNIAVASVTAVLGPKGAILVTIMILLSVFSAANSAVLTAPRVYYAMANDGLFFRRFAVLHARFKTPAFAIVISSAWAAVLAMTESLGQLISGTYFIIWIFHALTAMSVFVYRKRRPDAFRPYRVPGYPLTPVIFIIAALILAAYTVVQQPIGGAIGLGLVLLGVPVYAIWRARKRSAANARESATSS
ncbi:MAG: amino acid permease [Blastocatellia bacterium]